MNQEFDCPVECARISKDYSTKQESVGLFFGKQKLSILQKILRLQIITAKISKSTSGTVTKRVTGPTTKNLNLIRIEADKK